MQVPSTVHPVEVIVELFQFFNKSFFPVVLQVFGHSVVLYHSSLGALSIYDVEVLVLRLGCLLGAPHTTTPTRALCGET